MFNRKNLEIREFFEPNLKKLKKFKKFKNVKNFKNILKKKNNSLSSENGSYSDKRPSA